MNLLITSGGTREPIDDVRFITNVSTGGTGAKLAAALAARGHRVTLLHGEGAVRPAAASGVETEAFTSTADLQRRLTARLGTGTCDIVVHAAAVSDYTPAEVHSGKLTSYASELVIHLVPTPKLLPTLKSLSPRPLTVVGFKLTSGADADERARAVAKVFASGTVDAVIHNDLQDMAAAGDSRAFRAHRPAPTPATDLPGLSALVDWLDQFARSGV